MATFSGSRGELANNNSYKDMIHSQGPKKGSFKGVGN